jgi:hypothetical protein
MGAPTSGGATGARWRPGAGLENIVGRALSDTQAYLSPFFFDHAYVDGGQWFQQMLITVEAGLDVVLYAQGRKLCRVA